MTAQPSMAGFICINSMDRPEIGAHGALMDQVYRRQRLFYDATRKFYLLGRDHLLRELDPAPDAAILEIACGTGRNLDRIDRLYPGRRLFGLDISSEMLRSARAKLGTRAQLVQGDACGFDPEAAFGLAKFDRIVMSYSLSMIPDWQAAMAEALRHLAPMGELHIVDFGDQTRMPSWFDKGLRSWLARFHVSPRDRLQSVLPTNGAFAVSHRSLLRDYAQYACVRRLD